MELPWLAVNIYSKMSSAFKFTQGDETEKELVTKVKPGNLVFNRINMLQQLLHVP